MQHTSDKRDFQKYVLTSGENLFEIYRQATYRTRSAGQNTDQIRPQIFEYIPTLTHHSVLQKKRKGSVNVATTIYICNSF